MKKQTIILASRSSRRRNLLMGAGYRFRIEISEADEDTDLTDPVEYVEELSHRKVRAVAVHFLDEDAMDVVVDEDEITKHQMGIESDEYLYIVGADTVVILDDQILGKPKNEKDAAKMLRLLSGKQHEVYTGVTIDKIRGGVCTEQKIFSEHTSVKMREMTDEEIDWYVKSGEPMDKAGSYAIQGKAAKFIESIDGDFYNVVGLPICRVSEELAKMGAEID